MLVEEILINSPSVREAVADGHMDIAGEVSDRNQERESSQVLSQPLPVSIRTRNRLSLLLLLVIIAWFWQSLLALYSLTQQQSHYSHLLLIPFVSLYVFYLNRGLILNSREWSPLSGLIMVGLGAIGYWWAGQATNGVDHLSLTTLALVVVIWGIFLFC